MLKLTPIAAFCALAASALTVQAADLAPIHQTCMISAGKKTGTFRLRTNDGGCHGNQDCGTNMSDVAIARITGISLADLARSGAHLTATLAAEAGTFTCTGAIAQQELDGDGVFTPDPAFVARMKTMGISGLDADKLQAYAYLNVQSGWAQSLKDLGIHDLNADNLIALRVFNVDPAYARSITGAGYPLPTADQLVAMSCQGVNAREITETRALGYEPTFDQLIQLRIFKVTPEFIRRMQARGLKNLTLDKLVQIRIFNLAD